MKRPFKDKRPIGPFVETGKYKQQDDLGVNVQEFNKSQIDFSQEQSLIQALENDISHMGEPKLAVSAYNLKKPGSVILFGDSGRADVDVLESHTEEVLDDIFFTRKFSREQPVPVPPMMVESGSIDLESDTFKTTDDGMLLQSQTHVVVSRMKNIADELFNYTKKEILKGQKVGDIRGILLGFDNVDVAGWTNQRQPQNFK